MKEEIRENVEQVKDFVVEEMDSIPGNNMVKKVVIGVGGAMVIIATEEIIRNRNKIKQKLADTKEARKIKKMEKKEKKATFTRTVDEDGRTEYEVSEE